MTFQVGAAAWLSQLTPQIGAEVLGESTWEQGAAYAQAGRVLSIASADQGRMLLAEVIGNRAHPYQTLVTADPGVAAEGMAGLWRRGTDPWNSRCSCPVRTQCKHVAAVLVAAGEEWAAQGHPASTVRDWERVLAPLLVADEPAGPAPGGLDVVHPTGLIVELVTRPGPPPRRAPEQHITLQATRQLVTGQWAKRLPWNEIGEQHRHAIDARQRDALLALYRAGSAHLPVYSQLRLTEIPLDQLGVDGWLLLHRCLAAGVQLIGPRASGVQVELLPDIEAALAIETMDNGDLEMSVQLGDDLWPAEAERALIGTPAHGMWARWSADEGPVLALRGFTRILPEALRSVALDRLPIVVPEADVERFHRLFLPKLAGSIRLRSSSGPLDAAVDERAVLTLDVTRGSLGGVDVRLGVGHDLGGGVVIRPDDAASHAVRDPYAEAELIGELEVLDLLPGAREPLPRFSGAPALLSSAPTLLSSRVDAGRSWRLTSDPIEFRGLAATEFMLETLPQFESEPRVVVSVADDVPDYQEAAEGASIEVLADDSDNDWLDLRVVVRVEDQEVPFAPLFAALVRGDEILVLEDGTWFRLDQPELQRLRDLIAEARELADRPANADGARISRFHVSLWDDLSDLGELHGAQQWRERLDRLRGLDLSERPLPTGLVADLRPYQRSGFQWLAALWDARLGGVLADDMGLGKTLQTLALVQYAKEQGELDTPVLVIAPTSVLDTWRSEAARFTPGLVTVVLGETQRRRGGSITDAVAGADLVITSYAVSRIDADALSEVAWRGVLLDEAQFVKNPRSKGHAAIRHLRAPFVLAITGTPLENSLMDLWSLLALAAPGLYPRADVFSATYRRPIESGAEPEKLDQLRRRVRPLMLRRTKAEVAADLPEKQVQVLDIALSAGHARIYERHLQRERQRVLGLLDDPVANRIAILSSLTRLRQLALDPALVDEEHSEVSSAKVDTLVDHLHELHREGHRALVFSQFTRFLRRVESRLAREGITTAYLDGSTTGRAEVIRGFREGDATAFLISLKAGGFGLNLTEADYVYVLDPWWNPAAEAQAVDRAHRIGQTKPVMVYRLISADTIEEKVLALQQSKRDLFARVIEDGGLLGTALTVDDLRGLLT